LIAPLTGARISQRLGPRSGTASVTCRFDRPSWPSAVGHPPRRFFAARNRWEHADLLRPVMAWSRTGHTRGDATRPLRMRYSRSRACTSCVSEGGTAYPGRGPNQGRSSEGSLASRGPGLAELPTTQHARTRPHRAPAANGTCVVAWLILGGLHHESGFETLPECPGGNMCGRRA